MSICLGQIPYFLFYPSSGTAGSMPRPFPVRVRRHCPPCGFNMMTRSKGLPLVPLQIAQAARILCPLWPISWKAQPLGWTTYESFTLRVSPTHESAHSTIHSAPWARVILRVESYLTARVTLYKSSLLMGWGILSNGLLHGYGQFPWSLLTLPDLSM